MKTNDEIVAKFQSLTPPKNNNDSNGWQRLDDWLRIILTQKDAEAAEAVRAERERIHTAIKQKSSLVENPIETSTGFIDGSFYQIYRGHLEEALTPHPTEDTSSKTN